MPRAITPSIGLNSEPAPMVDMNTTPLIDVLLVLLIMFIITIPSQTHQVEVALPKSSPAPPDWIKPLQNDLIMTADGVLIWNQHVISDGQLAGLLAHVATSPEPPEVHFRPDAAARFDRVDQILAVAAQSGAKTFGFAGNEQYKNSI